MSNVLSSLFGKKPKLKQVVVEPEKVQAGAGDSAQRESLERLAKLRRATMASNIQAPANIKRNRLGAGGIN